MREINFDSSIEEIELKSNGELLAVLKVDVADKNTANRFARLIENIESISNQAEETEKRLNEKYKDSDNVLDEIIEKSRSHVAAMEDIIDEIDNVFGVDTIRNVFRKNYELNADFVPDEIAIVEFIEKIVPVMNELFGSRFEINKKKYNVNRRHMSKEQIIKEYMGKHE